MYPKVTVSFLGEQGTSSFTPGTATPTGVNVSNISQAYTAGSLSNKGFQLSSSSSMVVSPLDGTFNFFTSSGYPGYLSSATTAQLNFRYATAPENVYITFDPASGEYATSFTISHLNSSDTPITVTGNTNVVVVVPLGTMSLGSSGTLQLRINGWSVANHTVKVSSILAQGSGVTLQLTRLVDFTCSENVLDSDLSITPGICEQYATVNFYDVNNTIHNMARAGTLTDDATVSISVVTDNSSEEPIGTYIASEWKVEADNSEVTIECYDKSTNLDKINIPRAEVQTRNLASIISYLFDNSGGLQYGYADTETQTLCNSTTIPNSWWVAGDLKSFLNKVCAVGMLRVYWYNDKFYFARCIDESDD